MIATNVKRPRNVDWKRAAAILYGDWGTSKAYVIGLAFAVAGYASFWLIALMCVLTALVGLNYMVICRLYPDGGGVYQRAFRLRLSRCTASGKICCRRHPHHRIAQSPWTETHRRPRVSNFGANRDCRRGARTFQSTA